MSGPIYLFGSTGKVGLAWLRLLSAEAPHKSLVALGGSQAVPLQSPPVLVQIENQLRTARESLAVVAAAMTDVDECERAPALAEQVNLTAVARIAAALKEAGGALLFYSSDFIFGGSGPRAESDPPEPLSVYGRSKQRAEEAIRASGVEHLIVRINVPLAPPEDGESFYSFVTGHLKRGEPIRIVTDQWSNPLDTDRIARWSWEAWQRGVRGTLHLGGGTYATRFDIARFIADYVGADQALIQPIRTSELNQLARRPARGGLLIARQSELFGTAPDLPTILKSLPK